MVLAARFLVPLVFAASVVACNRAPDDLREWRPEDHRHQTESATPSDQQGSPQVTGSAEAPLPGLEEVTIAAYRRSCATCHGQLGRGDGPQGPMVKARDLSDPAWQASVKDEQIAETIVHGRGKMPPSGLPPQTVEGLVHLVRLFNQARLVAAPPGSANPHAGPAPSASTGTPAAPGSGKPAAASSAAPPK